MNKKDNRGFLLAESLIVSTFVVTVLIFLFTQFKNVVVNQKRSYTYNNVEDIYNLAAVSDFLKFHKTNVEANQVLYNSNAEDVNQCNDTKTPCDLLREIGSSIDAEYIICTDSEVSNTLTYIKANHPDKQDLIDFIERSVNRDIIGELRLTAKFKNGNFASIAMENDLESTDYSNGSFLDMVKYERPVDINDAGAIQNGIYKDDLYLTTYQTPTGETKKKYIYKGKNPSNYIKMGDELWRIVSIEEDGTLKIVQDVSNSINVKYDHGSYRNEDGSFKTQTIRYSATNTDYCWQDLTANTEGNYHGCNAWGNKNTTLNSSGNKVTKMIPDVGGTTSYNLPNDEAYLNVYLNGGTYSGNTYTAWIDTWMVNNHLTETEKRFIMSDQLWNIGPAKNTETNLAVTKAQEQTYKWKGRVGLLNVSEFVEASSDTRCSSVQAYTSVADCYRNSLNYNYLAAAKHQRFLTPLSVNTSTRSRIFRTSIASGSEYKLVNSTAWSHTAADYMTSPALYISPEAEVIGLGIIDDPYQIV